MNPVSFKHPLLFMWIIAALFSSCKKEEAPAPITDMFYKNMSSLKLEIAYEQGAEPYDISNTGKNVWEFAEQNVESLFIQRSPALDVMVPNSLGEMRMIPAQNKTSFTVDNIVGLANRYRQSEGTETSGNIFILFLNGYFEQNDTLRQTILGVHITGTTIVAVFKPLIRTSHVTEAVREFVEQSVALHEVGHAIGLVANGLPATTDHHDEANPAHCTNEDCVMFWQNESRTNIAGYANYYSGGKRRLIFGQECVADVTAYTP